MTATQPKSSASTTLTKPEAQHIRRMEGTLKDYQDEKLGIYKGQIDGMSVCYDKARQKREELQKLYEKRHQDVLKEIIEMRATIDSHTQSLHHALKQFSSDFEQGVADGKSSWRTKFADEQRQIAERNNAIDREEKRLDDTLEEEKQECTRSINEQGGVIRHQISERSGLLQEQIKQRKRGNEEFLDKFQERFGELRAKLTEESESRESRATEERAKAKKRFHTLNEDQRRKDATSRQALIRLKEALEFQQEERKHAQGTIVGNMMTFMEEFEKNIVANQQKLRANQAHMHSKISGGRAGTGSKDTRPGSKDVEGTG